MIKIGKIKDILSLSEGIEETDPLKQGLKPPSVGVLLKGS
jgi:hypothetical protein